VAISIPDANAVRLTTGNTIPEGSRFKQCVAAVALNPGPVSIKSTSPSSSGNALVEPTPGNAAGRTRYYGFNILGGVPAGSSPVVVKACIVEGLAGMTPGEPVYVDDTGALSHTAPTGATNADVLGLAISASKLDLR
jgi:hypothetical protein